MNKTKAQILKEKDKVNLGWDLSARPFELERIESQKVYRFCKNDEEGVIVLRRLRILGFLPKSGLLGVQAVFALFYKRLFSV